MDPLQKKIGVLVQEYKKIWPTEYLMLVEQLKQERKLNKDEYGSTRDKNGLRTTEHVLERQIYQVSETLDNIFTMKLTDEEMKEFKTKKMAYWFARTYKEFAMFEKL